MFCEAPAEVTKRRDFFFPKPMEHNLCFPCSYKETYFNIHRETSYSSNRQIFFLVKGFTGFLALNHPSSTTWMKPTPAGRYILNGSQTDNTHTNFLNYPNEVRSLNSTQGGVSRTQESDPGAPCCEAAALTAAPPCGCDKWLHA